MDFSFCLITKNEERYLEACLSPLKTTGMPIVVLDTGSTDLTVSIAKKYTPYVFDFTWQNDFALARNVCSSKAPTDFVFFIDADEITTFIDIKKICKLIQRYPDAVGQMKRISLSPSGESTCQSIDYPERLFNKHKFHYVGRIHEQVTFIQENPMNNALPYYEAPLTTKHEGYAGSLEEREKKARRNIALLEIDLAEDPEDPYTYYQLGLAYRLFNDFEKAHHFFEKGVILSSDYSLRYVTDLILNYGQNLISLNRFKDVLTLKQYLPYYKDNADILCMLAYAYMKEQHFSESITLYKMAAGSPEASVVGNNTFFPHHNLGCIYEAMHNYSLAKQHFLMAGDYPHSIEKLNKLPAAIPSVEPTRNTALLFIYHPVHQDTLRAQLAALSDFTVPFSDYFIAIVGPETALTTAFEREHEETVLLVHTNTVPSLTDALSLILPYELAPYIVPVGLQTILWPDALRQLTLYENASNADACLYFNAYTGKENSGENAVLSILSKEAAASLEQNHFFAEDSPLPFLIKTDVIKKALPEADAFPRFSSFLCSNIHSISCIGWIPQL